MTTDELAAATGVRPQKISMLENARVRPKLAEVETLLAVLSPSDQVRRTIDPVLADSTRRGWWEQLSIAIGPRQALYANLECGAKRICEYQLTFMPGLLQIPDFTQARTDVDRDLLPAGFDAEAAVTARQRRQEKVFTDGGPAYEVVLDELTVRRPAAPLALVAAQLDHLILQAYDEPRLRLRVLPIGARIERHAVPRSAFSIYTYPDRADPRIVAVDTVTSDLILDQPDEVRAYQVLYRRLRDAALPVDDSRTFLASVAEDLHTEIRRTE